MTQLSVDLIGCRVIDIRRGRSEELGIIIGSTKTNSSTFSLLVLTDDGTIYPHGSADNTFQIHKDDLPLLKQNIRKRLVAKSRMTDEEILRSELLDFEE